MRRLLHSMLNALLRFNQINKVCNFSICTMRLLLPAACPVPSALPILLLNTINLNEPKELFKFHLAWGTPGTWHPADINKQQTIDSFHSQFHISKDY